MSNRSTSTVQLKGCITKNFCVFVLALTAAGFAIAGDAPPVRVPLPGVLALLAIGGVAGIVASIRNRRK